MLTVVTWLYNRNRSYRPEHVNRFYDAFDKHYSGEYRRLCITDDSGVDSDTLPTPAGLEALPGLSGNLRRLWIWSREAAEVIGGRVFVSDIDCDIVGPLDPLLDREEDVVLWHDPMYPRRYSGGNMLITPGSRPEYWERLAENPEARMAEAREWNKRTYGKSVGAEMAWLCYAAGEEATFGPGIYRSRFLRGMPDDAKIIHYSGSRKPVWLR